MAVQVKSPERDMAVWEPLREMEDMERRFENMFRQSWFPSLWRWTPWEGTWMPAMDLLEKTDKLIITVELPGIKPEDVDVSVADGMLTIRGEKKVEKEMKGQDYHRSERSYGSFLRSMELPSSIDASTIKASFDNGLLEITIPKGGEAAPSKIKVAVRKTR